MTGAVWVLTWLGYLGAVLMGAGVFAAVRPNAVRSWLNGAMAVGSTALIVMTWSLNLHATSRLALPLPWPALIAAPIPLAALWAPVAGVLFWTATLLTLNHPAPHRIHYALLPLVAGVGIFLWSGDGLLLLMSWEFISAATYLGLVTTRRSRPVWNAGWALLALSEVGGMLLLIALVWLIPGGGSILHDSWPVLTARAAELPPAVLDLVMILALVAFGVKAGLFPVMIWMPLAEPEAPGVVAGIFSGLLTALAISGILAIAQVTDAGMAFGIVLLTLGVLGAVSGALYSVISRHVKRILAYSTLEILGLVFAGLGIWRIESIVAPANVASSLALDAAIVLLFVHAGAKFVLFAITDYSGQWSHTLDGLGGLIHRSREIGGFALLATLTLAAFPPLGGFVGEWLLLESVLKPLGQFPDAAVHAGLMAAGGLIALTAGIGVAAYLRWFGFIFLGTHRSARTAELQPPVPKYLLTLGLPLATVFLAGPGIPWFLPWLNGNLRGLLSSPAFVVAPTRIQPSAAAPLVAIGANLVPSPGAAGTVFFPQAFTVGDPYVLFWMGLALVLMVAGARSLIRRRRGIRRVPPWNGGAETFSARTSWSAEGFAHPIRLAFAGFYGLRRDRTDGDGARFYRHTIVYRLEEQLYRPLIVLAVWGARQIRRVQSGRATQYVAYVWIFVLIGILIAVIR